MMKNIVLISVLCAAGCATTSAEPVDEAAAATLAEYNRTGDVSTCLSITQVSEIRAVDEKTLLIRSGVSDYYVSDLSSRCNGATRNSTRFEYSTSTGQLCRNEIIRVVDNGGGFLTGSCGMGSFERLEKKPDAQ